MIEFLTLFLGLASGPQDLQLRVASPAVAAIELRLDGAAIGLLEGPAWSARIDLGPGLHARRLVAVARDAEGDELDRIEQIVNRPRSEIEVGLVLERDDEQRPTAALVNWQSRVGRAPKAVRAVLDGTPLPVDDPERIPLPPTDAERLHILEVELDFDGGAVGRRSISYGGATSGVAETDLTALVLRADKTGRRFREDELSGWVSGRFGPVEVVAVEEGEVDLVLVKGDDAGKALLDLEGVVSTDVGSTAVSGPDGMISLSQAAVGAVASGRERLQRALTLAEDRTVRLLLPHVASVEDRYLALQLFPASPPIHAAEGGLLWTLAQDVLLPGSRPEPRIADAVAIAGIQAAAGNRRRAVVLVLARPQVDQSRYTPSEVRQLLADLDVPLVVWRLLDEGLEEWPGQRIGDFSDLRRAVRELEKELDRQRVVWVAGSHLRSELHLTEAARRGGLEPLR